MTRTSRMLYQRTIDRLERLRSSRNGNPRFRIVFTDGSAAKTKVDSAVAYGLENEENIGFPVMVEAVWGGDVVNVTPLDRWVSCED